MDIEALAHIHSSHYAAILSYAYFFEFDVDGRRGHFER